MGDHDPRNPNWKPFQYLEQICREYGYDDMEARDIIEEHIGEYQHGKNDQHSR